jgi:hypothetical protein
VARQQLYRWRPTRRQLLWWAGGVAVLAFMITVICGYLFGWKWTGLVTTASYPKKTLWGWLDLLVVPFVLAIGGYLFTRSENRATQAVAERRALDDTLQAYLDGMAQLLTDKEQPLHSAQPGDSLSTLARARTLTVLSRLDGGRKRSVLQFLYESRLIEKEQALLDESDLIERRHNIISLQQADLKEAILSGANPSEAILYGANLRGADLSQADLSRASLYEADLSAADLNGADLNEADLRGANLSGADLRGANLRGAQGVTTEELEQELEQQPLFLEGATMPDGQKYDDWLKSKDSGEDKKNE